MCSHAAFLALVESFACIISPGEVVHAIIGIADEVTESAVAAGSDIEAIRAVFALENIIPGDILILLSYEGLPRVLQLQCHPLLIHDCEMLAIAEVECFQTRFVLLLRVLLIEHAVFLLSKSGASEAIATTATIEEEGAVVALFAELRISESKTLLTVSAFVAALGMHDFRTINAVLHVENPVAVHRVLVVIGFDREIAVFRVSALVDEVAVLKSKGVC